MSAIHILHLTDLHLGGSSSWDQSVLVDALKADLKKLRFSQYAPSFVIFSGDVVQAASVMGAYDAALNYSLEILEALGLDEGRMVIIPGNHDVNRDVVGPHLTDLKRWREEASVLGGANKLVEDCDFIAYVNSAFECFNSFAHEFASPSRTWSGPLSSTYYIRDLGISILALNSAALSGAGIASEFGDRANLCIPERAIVEALKAIPSRVPIITTAHHPISWLNDDNAGLVETLISNRTLAYFHGHLHESRPRKIQSMSGNYLSIQSGALYTSRDYWNGYAVISLDLQRGMSRVAYRRWFEQRREFAPAEDLGEAGTFYGTDESQSYWQTITPAADPVSLERWRQAELLVDARKDYWRFISNESGFDPFVPPTFDRDVPFTTESHGRMGSRLDILQYADILKAADNFVVSTGAETGKTTLLKHMAIDLCERSESPSLGGANVPVYISFSAVRNYSSYIETLIRQKLPELPDGHSVKSLLSSGALCILVDDVDFTKTEKRNALSEFIITHPKCRYIFTSSTTFVESSALRPEIVPGVPFSRVRLRQIENHQLLSLIENHGTTDPLKADQMLSRVLRDASALNVPLTAVTGTFIIQILVDDPDHTILNQAALIERYVEMLLQKYAPRELLPGTFDFRNKVDLLSYVAEKMSYCMEYAPAHHVLTDWCVSYLKGYGLSFSAKDLIDYFIEARIFDRFGDHISLRLRVFFEFFAASRMMDDVDFKEHVFADENYLQFANEIGFYAALNRKDKQHLEEIYAKFTQLSDAAFSSVGGVVDEDAFFEKFTIPNKDVTEAELFELQGRISSPERIKYDREVLLGEDSRDEEAGQAVVKETFLSAEQKWIAHLWLLSRMIKHMELIPDQDKRRLLSGILQGWVRLAANSMSMAATLAKDRRVLFHGVTYVSTLPENMPVGEMARRVMLSMPTAVAKMAANLLGTEKLRDQLEDGLGSETEPPTRQLMRVAILADIGISDIAKPADKVATALRGHIYLQHALIRKLYDVAVRFRLPKEEVTALQNLVSRMLVGIEHVPGADLAKRQSRVIDSMAQQRLVLIRATSHNRDLTGQS